MKFLYFFDIFLGYAFKKNYSRLIKTRYDIKTVSNSTIKRYKNVLITVQLYYNNSYMHLCNYWENSQFTTYISTKLRKIVQQANNLSKSLYEALLLRENTFFPKFCRSMRMYMWLMLLLQVKPDGIFVWMWWHMTIDDKWVSRDVEHNI